MHGNGLTPSEHPSDSIVLVSVSDCAHVTVRHSARKHVPTARSANLDPAVYEPARATLYMCTDRACLSSYPQVVVEGGAHHLWGLGDGGGRGGGPAGGAAGKGSRACVSWLWGRDAQGSGTRCVLATFGMKHDCGRRKCHSRGNRHLRHPDALRHTDADAIDLLLWL
jgi:hypothetical protein